MRSNVEHTLNSLPAGSASSVSQTGGYRRRFGSDALEKLVWDTSIPQ